MTLKRDVLKYVPLRWAATELVSFFSIQLSTHVLNHRQAGIPLKTHESSRGRYTESDLFDILGEIYTYVWSLFLLKYSSFF